MEEMDHDISLDVDVEEMEIVRPSPFVNLYGLLVAPCGQRDEESVETSSHAVPLANVNQMERQTRICHVNVQDEKSFILIVTLHNKYFGSVTDLFL